MTKFLGNILDIQKLPILIFKKQKKIEDFKILIRDDNQQIEIIFMPNLSPGEHQSLGGETSLGYAVTYFISKKDYIIIRSYRHR